MQISTPKAQQENSKIDSSFHDAIERFLNYKQREYAVDRFKSRSSFRYQVPVRAGTVCIMIRAKPWLNEFAIHAHSEANVPIGQRGDFLEWFAETNSGFNPLRIDLIPQSGEVRCGYVLPLLEEVVKVTYLETMEGNCIALMETLLPLLRDCPLTDHPHIGA